MKNIYNLWLKKIKKFFIKEKEPETVKDLVILIVNKLQNSSVDLDEKWAVRQHHQLGRWIRNEYRLWDVNSPVSKDAQDNYDIAHADDISGLVLDWAQAVISDAKCFDPRAVCKKFNEHWAKFGTTSKKTMNV